MCISSANPFILLCLALAATADRKLADNNCQCGVKVVRDNVTVSSWILYVHRTLPQPQTATCVGVAISSNIVLASRKCLEGESDQLRKRKGAKSLPPAAEITVTSSKIKGEGTSFPVLDIISNANCSFVGIQVEFDFTLRESENKPVCIPTREEPPNILPVGSNVTYVGAKTGAIQNLIVKKGQDCKLEGSNQTRQKLKGVAGGLENVLCVTFPGRNVELEVGQPLFIEIGKNPYRAYPYGYYTYLAGLSTSIQEEKEGQQHLFFLPITSLVEAVESLTSNFKTTWCPQPWPWLNAPEGIKRDDSLDCECGVTREQIAGRIVGGQDALPYEFPWMVLLSSTALHEGEYRARPRSCGATIINDRIILTAAHCISSFSLMSDASSGYEAQGPNQTYQAHLHSHLRTNDSQEITVEVVAGLIHPGFVDGWRKDLIEQDLALLILATPLNFSATDSEGKVLYRPTCLPRWGEHIDLVEKEGIELGFGYNDSNRTSRPDVLQKSTGTLQSLEACWKALNQPITNITNTTRPLICAMDRDTYAMQGDSGGPIHVKDEAGKHTQVGVFSFNHVVDEQDGSRFQVTYMVNLQELLPFLDYYSDFKGAKYCKK